MELFLVSTPGIVPLVAQEARAHGFQVVDEVPGGVSVDGDWTEVARANLMLRGPTRVLARLATFRAMHLAQLDKRARRLPWASWLRPDVPVRVEAVCRKSRIYHNKAAAQRVERAITETVGAPLSKEADIALKLRIEDDLCVISVDTTGPSLHKRGLKVQVNKAPMRETMAAMFLSACGYDGREPVYDPMCGSGTFPIEAAEIALGLAPGRARGFAFEALAVQAQVQTERLPGPKPSDLRFFGSDRDQGAITMAMANAERAGVAGHCVFERKPVSDIAAPEGPPGLVIVNPPYGGRIGAQKPLYGLYASLGAALKTRFAGWRVGVITSDAGLAKATELPFGPPGPIVDHGGTKIRLWQTRAL